MKTLKILLIGISTVLLSCGPSELNYGNDKISETLEDFIDDINDALNDSQSYDNKTYFTPPEWIIGDWYDENDTFFWLRFTESNVYSNWLTIKQSKNKVLNYMENGKKKYSLDEETATDSTYYFRIINNFDHNDFDNYLFQKVSNDSLIYTFSTNDGEGFTKKYFR